MIVDNENDEPIHEYVSLGLASGKLTLVIGGSSTQKTTTTIQMAYNYDSNGNVWAINANSKNKVYRRVYKFTDVELTKNYEW